MAWRVVLCGVLLAPLAALAATEGEVQNAYLPPPENARSDLGIGPEATQPAPLPEPLSETDAVRYRRIFALQKQGRWHQADHEIKRLKDRLLMGQVLAQRYLHPTAYRSKYTELRDWLAKYSDHPQAKRIYRLAMQRKPAKLRAPKRPTGGYLNGVGTELGTHTAPPHRSTKRLGKAERKRADRLKARIRARVWRGWPTGAREVLESKEAKRLFDRTEYDQARTRIAEGYFAYNKNKEALTFAAAAAARSGKQIPLAHWTAGLAAWRLGKMDMAGTHFEALARSKTASDWNVAAGAFWAARTNLIQRRPERVTRWLDIAAGRERTFYGLLARRALGLTNRFDWQGPRLDDGDLAEVMKIPAARRALALLQIGARDRAERELRKLYARARAGSGLTERVLAIALRGNLPGLAMRIGVLMAKKRGRFVDAALYPLPAWAPKGGFHVDRALLYALIRQESRFDPRAKSSAGARGLMQIMPRTATYMANGESFRGKNRKRLFDPSFNLSLGQKYVTHLLDNDLVRGDLFLFAAAYNGGPGKLAKWRRRIKYNNDPLLFIESIPSRETRTFIERVMANLWMYRQRLGQKMPSLEAVAAGAWPDYARMDTDSTRMAADGRN